MLRASGVGGRGLDLALLVLVLVSGSTWGSASTLVPVIGTGRGMPLVETVGYHILRDRVATEEIPVFMEVAGLEGLIFAYQFFY